MGVFTGVIVNPDFVVTLGDAFPPNPVNEDIGVTVMAGDSDFGGVSLPNTDDLPITEPELLAEEVTGLLKPSEAIFANPKPL